MKYKRDNWPLLKFDGDDKVAFKKTSQESIDILDASKNFEILRTYQIEKFNFFYVSPGIQLTLVFTFVEVIYVLFFPLKIGFSMLKDSTIKAQESQFAIPMICRNRSLPKTWKKLRKSIRFFPQTVKSSWFWRKPTWTRLDVRITGKSLSIIMM